MSQKVKLQDVPHKSCGEDICLYQVDNFVALGVRGNSSSKPASNLPYVTIEESIRWRICYSPDVAKAFDKSIELLTEIDSRNMQDYDATPAADSSLGIFELKGRKRGTCYSVTLIQRVKGEVAASIKIHDFSLMLELIESLARIVIFTAPFAFRVKEVVLRISRRLAKSDLDHDQLMKRVEDICDGFYVDDLCSHVKSVSRDMHISYEENQLLPTIYLNCHVLSTLVICECSLNTYVENE